MKRILIVSILLAVASVGRSPAQIPETFTNLKLIEADVSRSELIGIMRSWATALGVRCAHCHVGPDDLQGMDFATDEKATKQTARRMFEMARSINQGLRAGLPTVEAGGPARHVTCYTCHRGLARPPMETTGLLEETARTGGLEAAFAELGRLRREHSESGAYDLSVDVLNRFAQRALERGEEERALTALEHNRELFPEASSVLVRLAMLHASVGRVEQAKEEAARALELAPADETVRQVASRLGVVRRDG